MNPNEGIWDSNEDGCPGICDVDDDGDGLVDEEAAHCPSEMASSTDDDENGWCDDIYGYDLWNQEALFADPYDITGHGTHVAGILGAVGNDGYGIAGVNWNCKIVTLQLYHVVPPPNNNPNVIETSDSIIIDAIDYVIDQGIRLSNNSYGAYSYSQCRFEAMSAAEEAGHLFVCAAGNHANDNDVSPFYPASYDLPNIISVAATNNDDELADFGGTASGSNYGELSVDLGAPGMAIKSTIWATGHTNYYGWSNGTSQAAPHVTGVAALVWSLNPQWDYATVKDQILDSVRPVEALDGITVTGGVVDAYAAINDCNRNGIGDDEDVAEETSEDCNENYWPDECDIARGTSLDCDENDVPDDCQADCNNNDVADACDIANQTSDDCEPNGVPDECESPRACCLPPPEGGCLITTESCCDDVGGQYEPNKPMCTLNACPQYNGPSGGGDP